MDRRQPWDAYFLGIAHEVARRSTCPRKAVGCVLTMNRRIIATGYNGSLSGHPHCTEAGCLITETTYFEHSKVTMQHCIRAVHAETNAVTQSARNGCVTEGSTAYVTASPCVQCMMNLISAGVTKVIFAESYRLNLTEPIAKASGVALLHIPDWRP